MTVRSFNTFVRHLSCTAALAACTGGVASTAPAAAAPAADTQPYALRGVRLGITVDEFRAIPMPETAGNTQGTTVCDDRPLPENVRMYTDTSKALGLVTCQWFSKTDLFSSPMLTETYIDIGEGKAPPVFEFVNDGSTYRLFRIFAHAGSTYYDAIRSALTRGYGEPKTKTGTVQTRAGATFPSSTLTWKNATSKIELAEPCRDMRFYCLTYSHDELSKIHAALLEAKAAAAATKI